ncbi:DUF397 domain-containing protein [Actinacidiphila guanduensis]|uniref:DUF397 domain-containing protein n=1 Tax=Actinacidiphila guanduensis TaxID=310781 RepID=A0A1G9VJP2_9ACTN|nr:DUF397 domain-containing protein [Actinacidiphila guanduensis]SDM72488.1 protein of unknown function [Actinacidiphila guanduensis]
MGDIPYDTAHLAVPHGADAAGAEPRWRKSSHSNHQSNCVEIAELDRNSVGFRDSKDRQGPVLVFTRGEAEAFIAGIARGDFAAE